MKRKSIGCLVGLLIAVAVTVSCEKNSVEDQSWAEPEKEIEAEEEHFQEKSDKVADICVDLYERAATDNQFDQVEIIRSIVRRFGENGYSAVDSKNKVNMTNAERVTAFCKEVDEKKEDEISIIEVTYAGEFIKFDLHTKEGIVDVTRSYYRYENGVMKKEAVGNYQAEGWEYTENGYLLFWGTWYSEDIYILTLGGAEDYKAFRVQALDDALRKMNEAYLEPIGYAENNMFLVDWSEDDFGDLNFYDVFDIFYQEVMGEKSPYVADDNLGIGRVYQIPSDEFEQVVMRHFKIDQSVLQSKTVFDQQNLTYEYKPRGFYEIEYPKYPYPEVIDYNENADGTITLRVNVVFPYASNDSVYMHEVVVRPLKDGGVQYVSNKILTTSEYKTTWHSPRLTEDEWKEVYEN